MAVPALVPSMLDTLHGVVESLAYAVRDTGTLADGQMTEALRLAARATALAEACQVAIIAETAARGEVPQDAGEARDLPAWVRCASPAQAPAQAYRLCAVADSWLQDRWATLTDTVREGTAGVDKAAQILSYDQTARKIADPASLDSALDALVAEVTRLTPAELRKAIQLSAHRLTPAEDIDRNERKQRAARELVRTGTWAETMTAYRLLLDPEGAALLEAALDPLCQPRPSVDDDGREVPDTRAAATRRADALMELIARAVGGGDAGSALGKCRLIVTIDHETLLADVFGDRSDGPATAGAGTAGGAGLTSDGVALSPGALRRMACDAEVLPMVLGSDSEPLDVGRSSRLFTAAQREAIRQRDRTCSFPRCSIPANWCEVHHLKHWIQGGATRVDNGALLCGHHHTVVHADRWSGVVMGGRVQWAPPQARS